MNSYKKLLKNIIIFGFGNLGSKIISLVLVPIYTYYLSQTEYGTVDLVIVTVSMLLPIVSACTYEAVLRFVIEGSSRRETVITNALTISIAGYLIFIMIYPIL